MAEMSTEQGDLTQNLGLRKQSDVVIDTRLVGERMSWVLPGADTPEFNECGKGGTLHSRLR